eukprot:TRINITY_DN25070_c0_g1_i1.p1 TRINITY_DN25070_c0_g1~~TRINITY_DN25070_c0_g1_i1.p1  ORF type:complete len:1495 (+),score=176.94 TRINITY_DN25070_c0_g1_i1:79-4563(+)
MELRVARFVLLKVVLLLSCEYVLVPHDMHAKSAVAVRMPEMVGRIEQPLSLSEAKIAFDNWHVRLQPSCQDCSGGVVTPALNGTASLLQTENPNLGVGVRLGKAFFDAMTPQPAVRACLTLVVKLDALGAPGVTVKLSISGEAQYNICTHCVSWHIDADLAFNVGLDVLGASVEVGFNVAGGVKLTELTCAEASESSYCEWAHKFLPPEARMLESAKSTCHTDSPFEPINAFLKYQWQALKAKVHGQKHVYVNELDRKLQTYDVDMARYPRLFEKPYQTATRHTIGDRVLLATCVEAVGLRGWNNMNADRFCQLEIALAETTTDQNYERVYGGKGPRTESGCNFNVMNRRCEPTDRCWFKPSVHKMRTCKFAPKFMGEVWRSSFLDPSELRWNEKHTFRLPKSNSNNIRINAHVYDYDEGTPSDSIGGGELESVRVEGAQPVRIRIPLVHSILSSSFESSGELVVELQWLADERQGEDVGGLRRPLEAMSAAVENFVGKLPDYAKQVGSQLEYRNTDDYGIDYAKLSGRYLARWLRADVRQHVERDEVESFGQQRIVEDKNAPKSASECRWSESTAACEPATYCKVSSSSHGSFPWQSSHVCKLRDVAVLNPECIKDVSSTHCCNAGHGGCSDNQQRPCSEDRGMKCECGGHMWCMHTNTCKCLSGLCYNSSIGRCEPPVLDCTKGTPEQQKQCHMLRTQSEFQYRLGKAQPKDSLLGSMTAKVARLKEQANQEPCASIDMGVDDRVMNFERAIQEATKIVGEERDAFFTEVITSAANLFVRTVADVQAMFNIYFANNPNWDDDCLTLQPVFQNFYEFGGSSQQQSMRTQPYRSQERPSRRVKVDGTADMPGEQMADDDNPWCKHIWAADERIQSRRIKFAHKDPPRGASGIRSSPRQLHGTMMPHLWCVLVEEFRTSKESRSRPFGDMKYQRGWTLNFLSACNQLGFVSEKDESTHKTSSRFYTWRRYDCESVVLGSAFLTFFPSFAEKVDEFRTRIGTILEDSLQCNGRIDNDVREFPTQWRRSESLCTVSAEALLRRKHEDHFTTVERSRFIQENAQRVLRLLQDWTQQLPDFAKSMLSDFQELWSHDNRLTGLAYRAAHGVQKARDLLGTEAAVKDRVHRLKEHLVTKAWRSRGQANKALFPVPVKFETHVDIGFHANFGESRDICKVQLPVAIATTFQYIRQGNTYLPHASDEAGVCASGSFAPLHNFQMTLRGCTRTVTSDDSEAGDEPEVSWSIGLKTIFAVDDVGEKLKVRLREAFSQNIKALTRDNVKDDNVMTSMPWNMAKEIMSDPASFFEGDLSPLAHALTSKVKEVAGQLGKFANDMKSKYLKQLMKPVMDAISVVAMSGKVYRMLDVQLTFVRVGTGPFRTKFSIVYKKILDASISVSVPGLLRIDPHIHLTQRYDMSEVFAVVYSALKVSDEHDAYKNCLECLDKARHVFCYDKASQDSSCPVGDDASSCPNSTSAEETCDAVVAILDKSDCGEVDIES